MKRKPTSKATDEKEEDSTDDDSDSDHVNETDGDDSDPLPKPGTWVPVDKFGIQPWDFKPVEQRPFEFFSAL